MNFGELLDSDEPRRREELNLCTELFLVCMFEIILLLLGLCLVRPIEIEVAKVRV